ncbi:MAG: DUF5054 domain-containing protein [Eubacterium sp.]|nr:DUF5054 domain-containing protein [Eubacterium sp.]
MKKVFVVSKTHLDLGFTDYAENIRQKYINTFIPSAIDLAKQVNTDQKKCFVWTTGSWILKEALENGTEQQKAELTEAIQNGNIVPHAMPFTTHTELLDVDTLEYGLSIVNQLDALRGRKTIAAKMTDVPGHTKGLVKILAKHGIKFLHIGVNGASAVPEIPECFLWKNGDAEIVVVYSKAYGGAFKSDLIDEVLYFDHTLDNHGAPSPEKAIAKLEKIQSEFPNYEIEAASMDDFAEAIWQVRNQLPVVENEIGDSWIHGSAADPYKSASFRALMALKHKWLADGSMKKDSKEYIDFTDALLCISEHTCGMDNKMYFADYENYLKADFQKAREKDKVVIKHPFRDFPQNLLTIISRKHGTYKQGSYKTIEKSWAEQREYIAKAVSNLSEAHKAEANAVLASLIPEKIQNFPNGKEDFETVTCGKWNLELNKLGGIGRLTYDGDEVIKENDSAILEYHSYSEKDYDFWLQNYSRDLHLTRKWAIGDFARPLLIYVKGKYPVGRFQYKTVKAVLDNSNEKNPKIYVNLKCEERLCNELGAPRDMQIIYSLTDNGLEIDLSWFGKDANRLTEAIYMHLIPANGKFSLHKLGDIVDPYSVISKGGRNLHAVSSALLETSKNSYKFINYDNPLLSPGKGKILEYDNKIEDIEKDGFSYVLYDNVWGTNFPLWYENNAKFKFSIELNK